MSGARDQILGAIRRSLKRGPVEGAEATACEARLSGHPRGIVPARSDRDHAGRVELFVEMAEAVSATVRRVATRDDVPRAIAEYLAAENLPARVRMAPDSSLCALGWDQVPTLEIAQGPAEDADAVGLTGAFAAIAETGTLLALSGPEHPTTLNFMPDTHVVVLYDSQVVGAYEDAWDRVRTARVDGAGGALPRTVNMITGPSRTADIEQTLQLGAHGPRRLHIVLVHGDRPDA